ncbi:MAG TPA: ATP-dependent DNA helicase RecG [Thermoanaerobaculia bacterium]|nr:ATP-dependent DNA helicase RecG [Thermoanaerobaculia bacterium]
MIDVRAPLTALPGIGPKRAAALAEHGIATLGDLLRHLPARYQDRRRVVGPAQVLGPGTHTVRGRLRGLRRQFTRRRGLRVHVATLEAGAAALRVVWFNQPYLTTQVLPDVEYILHGDARAGRDGQIELVNPSWEPVRDEGEAEDLVPVYTPLPGLSPSSVRRLVGRALDAIELERGFEETVPDAVLRRHRLPPLPRALAALHRPGKDADPAALAAGTTPAHQRLVYGELLELRARVELARARLLPARKPQRYALDERSRRRLDAIAPFALTPSQRRARDQILADLEQPRPMQRLLQGDVGCGKTIVAAIALGAALESGLQGAYMAPTELLAEQHFERLRGVLGASHRVELVTASSRRALGALRTGEVALAIGTHALLERGVEFRRLGVAVIDEQHRFGVSQRQALLAKGALPDLLVMSATPIPRSLALTLYGDLDVSLIDQMPPGRGEVRTSVLPRSRRAKVYAALRRRLEQGGQAYIVLPLIEASAEIGAAALEREGEEVRRWLDGVPSAFVHGRLDRDARTAAMHGFTSGELRVLIATSVIEVGVDVAAATFLVIESAERFGLAQLHQLRGRIGRGPGESHCVALHGALTPEAKRRLGIFASTLDGFQIAEADLAERGPGDLEGFRQSGLPRLRAARLDRDLEWLEKAREDARAIVGPPSDPAWSRFLARLENGLGERDARRLTGG